MHVKKVRKIGNKIKLANNEYKLSDFDAEKNEILEELKNAKNNDLEDLVSRFQITVDENLDVLDLKNIPTKQTGYSLNPSIYEVIDLNNNLKFLLRDNVKVGVTNDDIRLKSNSKINQTLTFTEKSFFIHF